MSLHTATTEAERISLPADYADPKAAILYMLLRVKSHRHLAYYMLGTDAYARLIHAAASLLGKTPAEVETTYFPHESSDPVEDARIEGAMDDSGCGGPEDIEDLKIEWPESEHADFFFPVLYMNEALNMHGLRMQRVTARDGHYAIKIGGESS